MKTNFLRLYFLKLAQPGAKIFVAVDKTNTDSGTAVISSSWNKIEGTFFKRPVIVNKSSVM